LPTAAGNIIPSTLQSLDAVRFWLAVLFTRVGTGIGAAALTQLLEVVQHVAWRGSATNILDAAQRGTPSRHIVVPGPWLSNRESITSADALGASSLSPICSCMAVYRAGGRLAPSVGGKSWLPFLGTDLLLSSRFRLGIALSSHCVRAYLPLETGRRECHLEKA
jgi:hypothetical protein